MNSKERSYGDPPTEIPSRRDSPKHRVDNKMTRRQFLRRGALAVIGAGLFTGGYSWLWEPRHLSIERVQLTFTKLPAAFDGLKVVQFSDLHLGHHSHENDFSELMDAIMSQSPDLICLTGDIVDSHAEQMTSFVPYLASLKAPLGKFVVLGNHDYRGQYDEVGRMLTEAGFILLRNSHRLLKKDGKAIAVVGLDDLLQGTPDPDQALKGVPDGTFSLLLMHEPDYADTAVLYPFDIQLSGHSHGGQVRFPLIGAITTPAGSKRYIQGLYDFQPSGMLLYVNRGFGTTQLPIRLLCKPELTVFTLNSGDK
ncbi:metallophosphoesterase [Paenibacillus sp. IHBB 10380]|uniref:metallophosphoesterase n=1 Tax=Paenibacillus sp. IHBB 10380 TaxID=1566358 RepID=UPI0009E1CAF0|nr:metallophosphoesterase [Paenibacillus sp. IHBB 10380]